MIAGLEEVTDGEVWIGGREVTDAAPRARDIAMVFQNYALYPHMTVRQNLAFGLKMRKTPKTEINRRVDDVAKILGLNEMLDRKPGAALRRPAPARRDGTRDGARARRLPHGRAALQPRRQAARGRCAPSWRGCTSASA